MSSVQSAFSQRKTNALLTVASTALYTLAGVVGANSTAAVLGSVLVVPAGTGLALGSSSTVAANKSLTDIGKDLIVESAGSNEFIKLREVKFQSSASTWVTGYVVVESNFQDAAITVARV